MCENRPHIQNIQEIYNKYRKVRIAVFNEATRPENNHNCQHMGNQVLLRTNVENICAGANLANFNDKADNARLCLWNHLWTKIRYAGIGANAAGAEINEIANLFDNYNWFSDQGWDTDEEIFNHYFKKTGPFEGLTFVRNRRKLAMTINVARQFRAYFEQHRDANAIDFVNPNMDQNVFNIHNHLMNNIGYRADLTALHFMMDVGFPVIKPDLVISRLCLDWGWLHFAVPDLPPNLTREDLMGRGNYGGKFKYTSPIIYRPIIELAQNISAGITRQDLHNDIGWATENPIREFDIFIVKAGQLPEAHFGIARRIFN